MQCSAGRSSSARCLGVATRSSAPRPITTAPHTTARLPQSLYYFKSSTTRKLFSQRPSASDNDASPANAKLQASVVTAAAADGMVARGFITSTTHTAAGDMATIDCTPTAPSARGFNFDCAPGRRVPACMYLLRGEAVQYLA